MPNPKKLPVNSNNRTHDLSLVDFYIKLKEHGNVRILAVERDLGCCRPDIVLAFNGVLYYIELQLTHKPSEMKQKLIGYEKHIRTGEYKKQEWQPEDKSVKPVMWVHSAKPFDLESPYFKIKQTRLDA
jgi:hypothetical protein